MGRKRRIGSVKTELVKKAREAMLAAVQLYNNPQVTFKAEAFITLSVIGGTYMLHATIKALVWTTAIIVLLARRKLMIEQSMVHISIGNWNAV